MQIQATLDGGYASSIDLARRLHDTIAQRLTGLSCFLGDRETQAPDDALERCRDEIHAAIDELREALDSVGRSLPARVGRPDTELAALRSAFPALRLDWRWSREPDISCASLVDSFLVEAICNVRKHARPTHVTIDARLEQGAIVVSVTNDGVSSRPGGGTRQGSRLLGLEATAHGAITDSHAERSGHWRQRLIMPCQQLGLSA